MKPRLGPFFVLPLALLAGCSRWPPQIADCEEFDLCGSSGSETTGDGGVPTSGDTVEMVTDAGSGTTTEAETEVGDTTGQPAEPPAIVTLAVIPDYIAKNGIVAISVQAENADGVRMQLDTGEPVALTAVGPGAFAGEIEAFTELENGKHMAVFTPWRDALDGEPVTAYYTLALPPGGYEVAWQVLDVEGSVMAIDVLPDGRPVELGTYHEKGESRCYLRLRETDGALVEHVDLLPTATCSAIDLKIDRETGVLNVLLDREDGMGSRWWAGEIAAWGAGLKNIGIGEVDDTALALASRPGLVAVCGAKPVVTDDKLDAMAVLLRPNEPAQYRLFDYKPAVANHEFTEKARDCAFADDTLVLVGEAHGKHIDDKAMPRERVTVIEYDIAADVDVWTVAGPGPGVQSRALAVAVDDAGRYHLAGYTCLDVCAPEGDVRIYDRGALVEQFSLGPLGSEWFGPHDIAWSPAGYSVVALGEQQGQFSVFKVQAFAAGSEEPVWTFWPNDQQGMQLALAVAIGPFGEVYAGGLAETNHPAFAVIGG